MLPSARFSQPLAIAGLTCLALLCLVSLGESLKVLSSASLAERGRHVDPIIKRTWESELGPFSPPPPQDVDKGKEDLIESHFSKNDTVGDDDDDDNNKRPGIHELDTTLSAVDSIVASIFSEVSSTAPVPGNPTQPIIPASSDSGLFGSVISILAGPPSAIPVPGGPAATETSASSGGVDKPLGGVLSALSQVGVPSITAPPTVPTGSGGLAGGLDVLDGVASALDGVLGSPNNSNSGGLIGQLSADIVGPIESLAADTAAIIADPAAAIHSLQSQVSSVLDSLPSAVAAGVQIANNVGGQIAEALNATTDILDRIPDVASGVADQLGSLLNAAPQLATGLPAAALSAVNHVESILTSVPGLGGDVTGILDGLQDDLSLAVVSAIPEVSSLAGVVGTQVVGILPLTLQPLVSGVLSTLQNDVTSLGCQVSDIVSGTAIIFNVPCNQGSSATPSSIAGPTVTAPVTVSASITVGESLPLVPIQPTSTIPQLASMLSSLSSSLLGATPIVTTAEASGTNPVANAALSGLSSLLSQISDISLTAAIMPSTQLAPPTPPASASPGASSVPVAATTIYYVQTITALITSTAVKTSTVTECPLELSPFASAPSISRGPLPVPLLPPTGTDTGPCPGQGYTCDDCLEGWFCPPVETPALPAPCGYGWPCYHCDAGWFCVPTPQIAGAVTPALISSTTTSAIVVPTLHPATNGFQYAGCYADNSSRALRDTELLSAAGEMTNALCIDFCQAQGFTLAGAEDGTECHCGSTLIGSILLPVEKCNTTCAGDPTGATMCGGSWALSVWSPDGTVQQVQDPENQFVLPITSGLYHPGGVRISKVPQETAIYAWPPPTLSANMTTSVTSPGVSDLESSVLAVVASEASGLASIEPASASAIVQSVSSLLNKGISSIASSLAIAAPVSTGATLMTVPSGFPMGPGPIIPSTTIATTAATLFANTDPAGIQRTTMAGVDTTNPSVAADDSDGSNSDDTKLIATYGVKVPMALGPNEGRWSPRRRAHWA
ncbi:WSC domain-containing protein 2 [Cytospora mali]|uniref:WSC domain-containing protein 2 n=1 Tax=Cytospora mali TaxID=578113 RepID=A0A194W1E1_CYTMA|nr:WSC domain-containing protein 2 [Valsa mali]